MDDLAIVVKCSDRVEWLLIEYYHAKGKGLQEIIQSCEERIPEKAREQLKYIEAIKSEALSHEGYKLANKGEFLLICKKCEKELQPRSTRLVWYFVLFLIFASTAGALWFYIENWSYITGQ